MTTARFGESVWWNPALLALPDAAPTSFSVLGVDGFARTQEVPLGFSTLPLRAMGLRSAGKPSLLSLWADSLSGAQSASMHINHAVQWTAMHSNGVGFSVQSRAVGDFRYGGRVFDILGGSALAQPTPEEEAVADSANSEYALYTNAVVSHGLYLGSMKALGHVWGGVSAKYSRIHMHGRNGLRYGSAGALAPEIPGPPALTSDSAHAFLQSGFEVRKATTWAADVGLALNPVGPVLISLNAVNLYQMAGIPETNRFSRSFWSMGRENGDSVLRSRAVRLDSAALLDSAAMAQMGSLVEETRFFRVLRVGADYYGERFQVAVAGGVPLENVEAIGRDQETLWSVSAASDSRHRPRFSVTEQMGGSRILSIGGEVARCKGTLYGKLSCEYGETQSLGFGASYVFGTQQRCGQK